MRIVEGLQEIGGIVANETTPIVFHLSPGQAADDPEARKPIPKIPELYRNNNLFLLMDKACEGIKIRDLASLHNLLPVVPHPKNRKEPWEIRQGIAQNAATSSNVTSDATRPCDESSPAATNSMSCLYHLSPLQ